MPNDLTLERGERVAVLYCPETVGLVASAWFVDPADRTMPRRYYRNAHSLLDPRTQFAAAAEDAVRNALTASRLARELDDTMRPAPARLLGQTTCDECGGELGYKDGALCVNCLIADAPIVARLDVALRKMESHDYPFTPPDDVDESERDDEMLTTGERRIRLAADKA